MKHKTLILLLIVSVLVCSFTGCAGTRDFVEKISKGLPLWYQIPKLKASKDQVAFTGIAYEQTERQAELVAKQNLIDSVADYLGVESRPEDFREFVQTGCVEKWGLQLKNSFKTYRNAQYVEAVLAVADIENLERNMSEEMILLTKNKQKIVDLVLEGDSHIKAGEDITGVECYIKSMVLSKNLQPDDDQYSFESILNEVVDILESSRMKMKVSNATAATCVIMAQRKETMLYENISYCPIKASYLASNGTGNTFTDSFTYLTNEDGIVNFEIKNNTAARKGTVTFEYDLDSVLQSLQKVAPKTADLIRGIIKEKAIEFDYERDFKIGALGLVVYEFSKGYIYNPEGNAVDIISEMFNDDGTGVIRFESSVASVDDDSYDPEMVSEFFEKNPDLNTLVVIRAAVSSEMQNSKVSDVVTMEGRAVIYSKNGSIVYDSGVVNATGFGSDYDQAQDDASNRFCHEVYVLLKGSYV